MELLHRKTRIGIDCQALIHTCRNTKDVIFSVIIQVENETDVRFLELMCPSASDIVYVISKTRIAEWRALYNESKNSYYGSMLNLIDTVPPVPHTFHVTMDITSLHCHGWNKPV